MKIRFIIIAVLLALRLYGANNELIKTATAMGMTITAFSILFMVIRGRDKRPMGGKLSFAGIILSVVGVIGVTNILMRSGGMTIWFLPIVFGCLGAFALALVLMKSHNRLGIFTGGMLGGGAVALVCVAFISYLVLGAVNGGFSPMTETYTVALDGGILPFAWAGH